MGGYRVLKAQVLQLVSHPGVPPGCGCPVWSCPGSGGTPPPHLPTHIPPDAFVHWLHEEGGAETAKVHHQWDGGDEPLWGGEGTSTSGPAPQAQGPLPQPARPAHLGQVEGVGEVHGYVRLGQVHNEPRAHVQQANLGTQREHGAGGQSGKSG